MGRESNQIANYRLHSLKELNNTIPIINPTEIIALSRSKIASTIFLSKKNIPQPKTWITEKPEEVISLLEEHKKLVLKPDVSSRGEGIFLVKQGSDEIYTLLDYFSRKYGQGLFLLQEFISSPKGDYRVLVINNEIIGSVCRKLSTKTSKITTNSFQGGNMSLFEDEQLSEAALAISEQLPPGFYALDFVKQESQFLLLEINSCPGWASFETITHIPVGTPLVNFLSSLVK
jgi:RimK family alpha-L-glutamate ligase